MASTSYAAVDLGATSGRVVRATVSDERIEIQEVHRFRHEPQVQENGELHWEFDHLLSETLAGLKKAREIGAIRSIAVDTWGVDYGLLDSQNHLLAGVQAYRSPRHAHVIDDVTSRLTRDYIYGITGIQFMPINTIYQLVADAKTDAYTKASRLLMIPDLINNALVGSTTNDVTNASTTQLTDARTRTWSKELISRLNLKPSLFPQLHEPATDLGVIDGIPGLDGIRVVSAASHDTASAVAGIPLKNRQSAAYISSGTWSLVGVETLTPMTTPEALAANVTNELGINNTVRLLKNVTGMWLLEECRREWATQGVQETVPELVADAKDVPGKRALINPDDPLFAAPGPMVERIQQMCSDSNQFIPTTHAEVARVIFDSLADAYQRTLTKIEDVAGMRADVIHVVGGGSANNLLNQLTADATGRTVLAGPLEATVFGNVITQAIADGKVADLDEGRRLIAKTIEPKAFEPRS